MNSSWLIPLCLGFRGFSGYNTTLCNCIFLGEYNRFSKKYNKYGDDEYVQ